MSSLAASQENIENIPNSAQNILSSKTGSSATGNAHKDHSRDFLHQRRRTNYLPPKNPSQPPPRPASLQHLDEFVKNGSLIRTLTDPDIHAHVAILVRNDDDEADKEGFPYIVCKAFPPKHPLPSRIYWRKKPPHHPTSIAPLRVVRGNDDASYVVKEEFADGGSVADYINKIKERLREFNKLSNEERAINEDYIKFRSHQIQFCKSVARQLLEYCAWLQDVVRDTPHRNINPTTILLSRDGWIKVKHYNTLAKEVVDQNIWHFGVGSAFMAPELADFPETLEFETDVWAVGAVLYAIMIGDTLLPAYHPIDPARSSPMKQNVNASQALWDHQAVSSIFRNFALRVTSFEEWIDLFGDPALAFIARQCLIGNDRRRPRASQLLSFMHVSSLTDRLVHAEKPDGSSRPPDLHDVFWCSESLDALAQSTTTTTTTTSLTPPSSCNTLAGEPQQREATFKEAILNAVREQGVVSLPRSNGLMRYYEKILNSELCKELNRVLVAESERFHQKFKNARSDTKMSSVNSKQRKLFTDRLAGVAASLGDAMRYFN